VTRCLLVVLALAGCGSDPGWSRVPPGAAAGEPTIAGAPVAVPRLAASPLVDGKLDEPPWTPAAALGPLVDPGDGRAVGDHPVAAFARLGWDDSGLWLGMVVRDRAPTSPFSRSDDDPHVWGAASGIELVLQPGDPGDNRDYYEIQVDINGAVFDSHFDDYNAPRTGAGAQTRFGHQEWSSALERAVHVEKGRFYSIEAHLPWSALQPGRAPIPPRPGDVWRMNLYSFRDGQRRALAWSPLRGQGNFHRATRWGRVQFTP
jgi:hypothetical protein